MEYSSNGLTIKIEPRDLKLDEIRELINAEIPKIIFKDDRLRKLSYNEMEYNEHQIRRVFKGQTYLTFKVLQTFTDDGSMWLRRVSEESDEYNALVKVSKRDIRTLHPALKLASKEEVYERAEYTCEWFISDYKDMLNGDTFSVKITDNINNASTEIPLLIADKDFFLPNIKVWSRHIIDPFGDRFNNFLKGLSEQKEYQRLFNRYDIKQILNNIQG